MKEDPVATPPGFLLAAGARPLARRLACDNGMMLRRGAPISLAFRHAML